VIRLYVGLRNSLNVFGRNRINIVAIGLEKIIRQVEHFDAHQLIYQSILISIGWENSSEICLSVGNLLSRDGFVECVKFVEEFVQRSAVTAVRFGGRAVPALRRARFE
jgi:hypothetical protein